MALVKGVENISNEQSALEGNFNKGHIVMGTQLGPNIS